MVLLISTPAPPPPMPKVALEQERSRLRWANEFLTLGVKATGSPEIRVGRRMDFGGASGETTWFYESPGSPVRWHLRSVLQNQIVFDVGDHTDWPETRIHTHALWAALSALEIPFIASLSGGKGTHTEVFLPAEGPQSRCLDGVQVDWRWPIANRIVAEANRQLGLDTLFDGGDFACDPLLIAPNVGSRLVREFGERKGPTEKRRKLPWHVGQGPAAPLPESQSDAYGAAEGMATLRGSPHPSTIPICDSAEAHDTRWVPNLFGGRVCPTGPTCFDSPWGTCAICPIGDD